MKPVTSFYIAGLQFRLASIPKDLKAGEVLSFQCEPDNPYDENAIKICVSREELVHIGYVPKKITNQFHGLRESGIPILARLEGYYPNGRTHQMCLVGVKSS